MVNFLYAALKKLSAFVGYNIAVLLSCRKEDLISCNAAIKDSCKGDVYILFTGGSLRDKDLGWLADKDVIATNLFFMSPWHQKLKINHYVIIEQWSYDLLKFMGFALDMIKLRGMDNSRPTVWMSHTGRHYLNKKQLHFESNSEKIISDLDVRFVKPDGDFVKDGNINADLSVPCNTAQGATVFTIFLAMYLGYKRIFLLGYDYGKTPMTLGHLYENWNETIEAADLNAMAGFDLGSLLKIREELIERYACSKQVEIFNIVDNGFSSITFNELKYSDLIRCAGTHACENLSPR